MGEADRSGRPPSSISIFALVGRLTEAAIQRAWKGALPKVGGVRPGLIGSAIDRAGRIYPTFCGARPGFAEQNKIAKTAETRMDIGSPTRARTWDLRINSPSLYQLSYRGTALYYIEPLRIGSI